MLIAGGQTNLVEIDDLERVFPRRIGIEFVNHEDEKTTARVMLSE